MLVATPGALVDMTERENIRVPQILVLDKVDLILIWGLNPRYMEYLNKIVCHQREFTITCISLRKYRYLLMISWMNTSFCLQEY